jgi:deazaflavin-dependent oxidoreductase (nitroreductase family)
MEQGARPLTNADVIAEFRAHGGRVGGPFQGAPLILLTTRGARSGREHTTPVAALWNGDQLVVFGTNAGSDRDPAWAHNLRAHPAAQVESPAEDAGTERFAVHGVEAQEAQADHLYARQVERDPGFGAYRERTARRIPVFLLRRTDAVADPGTRRRAAEHLLQVHAEIRRDLAALRHDIATARAGGPAIAPDVATEIGRRCLTSCRALHQHHTGEDAVFDALERELPSLVPVIKRLRREHAALADTLNRFEALQPAGDTPPTPAALAVMHDGIDVLAAEMEAHFDYEELELVPALIDAPR